MIGNKPTEKMVSALRRFKVPEEEIQKMSFPEASRRLDQLITRARSRDSDIHVVETETTKGAMAQIQVSSQAQKSTEIEEPVEVANSNLKEAGDLVMEYFDISDKSKLTESHIGLIQELSRQIYAIRYWTGKDLN